MKTYIVLIILLVMGCSKNKNQEITTQLETAQSYINEEKYTEAINILESLPQDNVKVVDLISTAYAGRAGFSSLEIYDIINKNKENPQFSLYEIAKKFDSLNILDSQKAIDSINKLGINPDLRPVELNLKYSIIQIYKISQILSKNINKFKSLDISSQTVWNPCNEIGFLSLDIRDIIISINRAVLSIKNIQKDLYEEVKKIQIKYEIDDKILEDEVVKLTDINRLRIKIGDDYSAFVGENTLYSCDSVEYSK